MTTPDIDWNAPRSARRMPIVQQARRQCAACDLTYVVALDYDGPPLCDGCRADVGATRARIRRELDANIAQALAALDAWDAVREPRQAAWDAIQAAQDQSDYAARCARHRAAGNVYGQLLDAQATYERQVQALEAERGRLERAWEVVRGI